MASAFDDPRFHNEEAAFAALEAIMWPGGKPDACPCCGVVGKANKLAVQTSKASKRNPHGKPVYGVWKCYACRQKFTVRKGTIFEESRLELHLWLQAAFLMCSSKKGVSANQLHRTLGVTLKTAWFLAHRLREAMAHGVLNPFGSGGGAVESDETFMTRRRRKGEGPRHNAPKMKVLTLIDRTTGQAHSNVIANVRQDTIMRIVDKNVSREARMMTDQARWYQYAFSEYAGHETVDHSKEEYVRGEAHTNTAEGYFSLFKKGMKAVYQHCDEKHLHRYFAEFDFRYNHRIANGANDHARTDIALRGAAGKRLTYRDSRV
ncbi:MAG TPA: IS1595 family transposase [Rhizomicrobium sp.]|nr:IS1595 family transposase [Rhizomicrobium sp.]